MQTPEICKLFGGEIDRVEYIDTQKDMNDSYLYHGIRIGVYLRDEAGQYTRLRCRAHSGMIWRSLYVTIRARTIDRAELLKGRSSGDLSESFIIFICDFNYFGPSLAVSKRVSMIKDTAQVYEDGSHVIFLNNRCKAGNAGLAIMEYWGYIRTNDDSRGYTTELLHKTIEKFREVRSDDKEVLKFQDAREEARAEGRAEGKSEGRREGIVSSIQNLMKSMNLSAEQAQYLEMLKQ